VASYLDARHHQGTWLVRMEDLDGPRCKPGAADDILRTLELFGLEWDEEILYQSRRSHAYEAVLESLRKLGVAYLCACTRKEIADSALHGVDGQIYPGTCRNGIAPDRVGRAWRVRTDHSVASSGMPWDGRISFDDALQGHVSQHLEQEIGDFVVKRADGLFAYQLAVVVDDAFQGISHVVRGADLIASTPRQIYLQQLLGMATPGYMHLPVVVNASGEKLSKQTLAAPVVQGHAPHMLWHVLDLLRQQPPASLQDEPPATQLQWAVEHWRAEPLQGVRTLLDRFGE